MSKRRPIVLVDMDGVLADFDGATETFLQTNHPDIPLLTERQNFYFHHDYPEHKALLSAFHTAPGFFRDLPLVDGAVEGWKKLHELGYEPRICSSPLASHPDCINEKKQWLDHHLGSASVDSAIFTSEKFRIPGLALIDDKPIVTGADEAIWQHIIFDRSYNKTIDSQLRLRGWNDPNLADLLARCALGR